MMVLVRVKSGPVYSVINWVVITWPSWVFYILEIWNALWAVSWQRLVNDGVRLTSDIRHRQVLGGGAHARAPAAASLSVCNSISARRQVFVDSGIWARGVGCVLSWPRVNKPSVSDVQFQCCCVNMHHNIHSQCSSNLQVPCSCEEWICSCPSVVIYSY